MKEKINVSKLIKEKYKDNTLELQDLFEEIDLILNESDQSFYHSKVIRNGISDSIPENQESENISHRINGPVTTRNPKAPEPGYNGKISSNVIPDKIAEVEKPISEASQEPVSVTVPDLFSAITNSSLVIKDDDRQIINEIVSSFGSDSEHWSEKIKSIQKFITQNTSESQFSGDLREAIAKLIYLNLFKKISYFTAQPGKLFEYIIAPIIGPDSKVVGKDDQDIIDVDSANTNGYSIKLFTGEASGHVVQGSIERLREVTTQIPVQYIIAVVDKNSKTISFAELSVSMEAAHFKGWKEINKTKEGTFLSVSQNEITKYGILVSPGGQIDSQFIKDVVQVLGTKIKTIEIQSKIDSIQQFMKNSDKTARDLKNIVIDPFRDISQKVKDKIAAELPNSDKKLSVENIIALNQKIPKYFENLISYILTELEK